MCSAPGHEKTDEESRIRNPFRSLARINPGENLSTHSSPSASRRSGMMCHMDEPRTGERDTSALTDRLPARGAFDIPTEVVYLNCAYMGPLPRAALAAGHQGMERKAAPWHIGVPDFFEPVERARSLFADLVGGDSDGVCIIPSVSYGTALAAANLTVGPGQRIVVLSEQFPSNVYVWHDLAARTGAEVCTVTRPSDSDWTAALEQALDERCSVVAVPACHWTDGTVVDLVRVGQQARSLGASLVVDACQAAGAIAIDVQRIQPDFLITAAYKWLLGPYSVGFCWVAPKRREGQPLEHNWIARAGSDDFAGLVNYSEEFADGARRYDMGEVSNFALMPAANASMELLAGWGLDQVMAHGRALTNTVANAAADLGFGVSPQTARSPHLLGLRLPAGLDPMDVAARLRERQVHVSVRGSSLRVSAHVFNTALDVDRLIAVLGELRR